jgi:hypothetical protein
MVLVCGRPRGGSTRVGKYKVQEFKDGGLGRRYKEQYDAESKETPFEAENQHAPRARSFVEARAGEVSALSRNEAAASGLPALRLLQRQSGEGSFGLGFVKQDDGVKPPAKRPLNESFAGDEFILI